MVPGTPGPRRARRFRRTESMGGVHRNWRWPPKAGPLNDGHPKTREVEALRERISGLSAAILRISASLEVATVLQEVVDSARTLTGARYGIIATVGDAGEVQDVVTSGFTPEERNRLTSWPDGPRLLEHLRDRPGPLRLEDLHDHVRSLGFSPDLGPSSTVHGVPMRHRERHVGNFFLAGKEGGGEFTSEDEEMLVLFASQAATAIANARTHRDEQRARADLEALVDTSPIGVVVFDAPTGRVASVNREARRIVESLRKPDHTPEQLLEVITCRFADGREFAFDRFPLVEVLSGATTVRAEEVELSVPYGRTVTTLVNATPIRSDDGAVVSMVVTLQDLAPLRELEGMRAEFMGMVSHELRAPLTSIKGSAATVLNASRALDPAEVRQFFRIIDEQANHMDALIHDLLDAGRIETGTLAVAAEPTEIAGLVDQARNTFISGGGRHTVLIDIPPELPPVMADRQRIAQVLNNLFSNAARHSPESLPIRISASREGVHVAVSVSDEGRGVPAERLSRLFQKYAGPGTGKGRAGPGRHGLGLIICKGLVEAHGGRIRAASGGTDRGTRFTFTLPVAAEAGEGVATGAARSRSRPPGEGREPVPVLVVDDDPQTLRFLRDTLTAAGYAPVVTGGPEGLSRIIEVEKPHLVLLDLMLPGTDGMELMESVPGLAELPVIFISGYGRDETIARALESGAEDYIVKPFSPTELTARIRAALRRREEPEPFMLGDLAIHYEARRVTVAGRALELTATEYGLLRALSLNAGRVSTYDMLLRQVWGRRDADDTGRLRTVVKKLRRKLGEDAARPSWIFSERGVGYRMPKHGAP